MEIRFLTADDPEWEEAFFRLPKDRRDVFYGPDYARLCQQTTCRDHRVLCALADTTEGPLLYPFVIRALSKVAGLTLPGLFDMVGLYGRNGVVCRYLRLFEARGFDAPAPSAQQSGGCARNC